MKKTLLFGALMLGTIAATAQVRTGEVTGTRTLGTSAIDASRAVTDTLSPGEWANDPNTQLFQYGALCPPDPGVPCGYIIGTNGYGDLTKAQQYLLLDYPTTMVEGLIFWFYAKSGNPNSVLRARLYRINGPGLNSASPPQGPATPGIAPNTVLVSKDFTLAQVDTGDTESLGFTTVMFDSPVFVNQEFAAGFNMGVLAATDSIALLGTADNTVGFEDFSWEQWDNGTWATMNFAWGLNIDMCIFVLVDNSSVGINEPGSMNNMRMSFLNGNISNGTVQLGYDVVEAGRMDMVVHSNNGQIAYQQTFGTQGAGSYQHTFSTQGWASGTYYVTLKNNGRPLTKKLIVE
jgi:hypothetical protein